jgi:hypothetical protein
LAKPVTFSLGRSSRATMPLAMGIAHGPKDDRDRPRLPLDGNRRRGPACKDDVGLQADQLLRERSHPSDLTAAPTKVDPHVAAISPTQVREPLGERREERFHHGIVFVAQHEHADPPHPVALLRPRRYRQRRRAPEPRDELPPPHR